MRLVRDGTWCHVTRPHTSDDVIKAHLLGALCPNPLSLRHDYAIQENQGRSVKVGELYNYGVILMLILQTRVENCTTLNSASTSYAWPNGAAFDRTSSTSDCQRHNVGVLHNVDFNHLIQSRPTRVASTAGSAVVAAD